MKKMTYILMLGIAVAAVASVNPLTWKSTIVDLGDVAAGEKQELSFEFTNGSDQPVVIQEAKGSCGCTNVKYPQEEIAPGSSASIKAEFTSKKAGVFKKHIRIKTSVSENYTYLYFKGQVLE